MILKISDIPSEMDEIKRNVVGYKSMVELGLGSFVPELYLTGQQEHTTVILMEYLGENFECFMRRPGCVKDYQTLVGCLKQVYLKSAHKPSQLILANSLDIFRELAKTLKEEILKKYLPQDTNFGDMTNMFSFPLKNLSFSCWDFKPDNLFLKDGIIKHADPQDKVVGVPAVDLGIIAGIIRDIAKLPGADCGYELLLGSATTEVGQLLELSPQQSQALFRLGRLLQLLKAIKYRHLEGKTEVASRFVHSARERIQLIHALLSH